MERLHHKRLRNESTNERGRQRETGVENRDLSSRPQNSLGLMLFKRRRRFHDQNMKCKVRPCILGHSLFTFYNCVYVFSIRLFSNISQTVLGSSRRRFYRKFQVLSLGNKNDFNHRDKRKDILKVLRGQLFLGHQLVL